MSKWKTYDKGDALPEDYKALLLNLMAFQADSEYAGAQRVAENMRFAPRPEEAYRLSKKVMEEMGHGYYVWNLMQDLGVDVDARLQELVQNPENPDPKKVNVINGFRKENWSKWFEDWYDVGLFSTVVTPAAVAFLGQYRECSYLPWARVNVRIHKEEHGHLAFGVWCTKRNIEFGGEKAREICQSKVAKFMKVGLGFYGRPSAGSNASAMFDKYYEYGIKTRTPEELTAEYLELLESRLKEVGLELPKDVSPDYDMRMGYDGGDVQVSKAAEAVDAA
ncbi:Phenylacetic acid catabolic protein [Novispirillum itersonii]|uniref:Phenylacetic acid catabolic protein n=1 Tax=Novispirillum itersonii TaxID=189 RepID=UPI0003629B46|nr:Phenylacetic acid catabolic protein [Novispirillum itersonii]